MRILVVEDDKKVASFLEQGLREDGYSVDVAHDGTEGESMAHIHDYDLLILDVMLPGKTGVDIVRGLRREDTPVPILLLTAIRSQQLSSKSVILPSAADACATSRMTKRARCSNSSSIAIRTASQTTNAVPCHDSGIAGGEGGSTGSGAGTISAGSTYRGVESTGGTAGARMTVSTGRASMTGGNLATGIGASSTPDSAAGAGVISTNASSSPNQRPKLTGDDSEVGRTSLTSTSIHIQ